MEALKLILYIVVVVGRSTESFEGGRPSSTSRRTLLLWGSFQLPGWLYASQCTYICIYICQGPRIKFSPTRSGLLAEMPKRAATSLAKNHLPTCPKLTHPYLLDLVLHCKTKQNKIKAAADGGDDGQQPWPTQRPILFKLNRSGKAGEEIRGRDFWAPPKQTLIGRSGRRRQFPGRWASSGLVP